MIITVIIITKIEGKIIETVIIYIQLIEMQHPSVMIM